MARKPQNRINAYIPTALLPVARDIENFSAFIQICLEQAPDIMAFAMLHDIDPKKYHHNRYNMDNVVEKFNEKYPMDPKNPLTKVNKQRQGTWQTNSQKLPDVLF